MQMKNMRAQGAYLGLLLLACTTGVQAADNTTVTVSSNVTEGSCKVSVPAAQAFSRGHAGSEFTGVQRTAETMLLNITVENCQGNIPGKKPAILVTGTPLAGQTDIFADASSTAKNVGVAVREGVYSGPLSGFYVTGSMVSNTKPETYVDSIDIVSGGVYPYTLGMVSDGATPGLGQVKATLTFAFKYQ